jgi:fructose transport system substrate-binding protein
MKSKLRGAAALLAVSAVVFAGCSSDKKSSDTTVAVADTTAAAAETAAAETTVAAAADTTAAAAAETTAAAAAETTAAAAAAAPAGGKVGVSLILKTLSNPFFVSMQKDAQANADKLGVNLTVAAGKDDGDTATQIAAIEAAVAKGDKGILITPSADDVVPALDAARKAGLLVIALDTPPNPATAVDITFATDNYNAGQLIGKWAAGQLAGKKATIAMLDLFTDKVVSVDTGRDQGFLNGMGIIQAEDKSGNGKEPATGKYSGGDYAVACHEPTNGAVDGGKTAMETCLTKNPDINVVYTINEPAAQGAFDALKAAGKEKGVLIVSVDGGCKPGLELVASGVIGATAQQYPGQMAAKGMAAIVDLANGKPKPAVTPGLDFFNTGVALVTDKAVPGVDSISVADGQKICWG